MTRVGMKAGEAIESGMLTRQIERAQRTVEQHNFDARKQLLEYDDVANDQRARDLPAAHRSDGRGGRRRGHQGAREDVVAQLVDQYHAARGAPRSSGTSPGSRRRSSATSAPGCRSRNG